MVDLLPMIPVVPDDPFNSSPTDVKMMGPDVLQRHQNGEQLPAGEARTPLVSPALHCLLQMGRSAGLMTWHGVKHCQVGHTA